MFHNLFFVMTLSGSVVVALYGLTYPITQKYFPHAWRKRILHLALFFYLFPVPLFKYLMLIRLIKIFPSLGSNFSADISKRIDTSYMINIQENQFFIGSKVIVACIFLFCMAVITSVVIIKQMRQYRLTLHKYLSDFFQEAVPSLLEREFQKIKRDIKINRDVKLIFSKFCDTPMTIGIFSPTIVFPISNKYHFEPEDFRYILKHELLHIKYRDLSTKFLALFALALHWYNPVCHILFHELCTICELDCDYWVIKDTGDIQRRRYSNLILDVAFAANIKKEKFAVGLVHNSTATFERRILEMKRSRKNTCPILACVIVIIICLVGTTTAFAYQPLETYTLDDFDIDSDYTFSTSSDLEDIEPFPFDHFFTDEDGNIFPLESLSPHGLCKHEYRDGTLTSHTKRSDGSCVAVYRTAQMCKYCDYIKQGEIFNEINCLVCPH